MSSDELDVMQDEIDELRVALETSKRAYKRQSTDLYRTRRELGELRKKVSYLERRLPRLSESLIDAYAGVIISAETWCRRPNKELEVQLRRAVMRMRGVWLAAEQQKEGTRD